MAAGCIGRGHRPGEHRAVTDHDRGQAGARDRRVQHLAPQKEGPGGRMSDDHRHRELDPLAAVHRARVGQPQPVGGVPYMEFLAAGLVVMTMAQNAFANTSSSLVVAKVQGNITDLLLAPLSPGEFVALAETTALISITPGSCSTSWFVLTDVAMPVLTSAVYSRPLGSSVRISPIASTAAYSGSATAVT